MKKIIDELINNSIEGVDVYRYKNATWLIFTDETRWVVELTDEGTLWYNYKFFNDVFKYVSMECGRESNDYITGWQMIISSRRLRNLKWEFLLTVNLLLIL